VKSAKDHASRRECIERAKLPLLHRLLEDLVPLWADKHKFDGFNSLARKDILCNPRAIVLEFDGSILEVEASRKISFKFYLLFYTGSILISLL
jgi:hypothetical protein